MSQTLSGAGYGGVSDEELIDLRLGGDLWAEEELIKRYKPVVRIKARGYYLAGADFEDIMQEGMIGLFKAIRDYRKDRNASFHVFAELCVGRQILTAIKSANRQKHKPLNLYVSLNKQLWEDDDRQLLEVMTAASELNPEELMINRESRDMLERTIDSRLSGFERRVLDAYVQGKNYHQIAGELGRSPKSVDNALQRVKRKLQNLQ